MTAVKKWQFWDSIVNFCSCKPLFLVIHKNLALAIKKAQNQKMFRYWQHVTARTGEVRHQRIMSSRIPSVEGFLMRLMSSQWPPLSHGLCLFLPHCLGIPGLQSTISTILSWIHTKIKIHQIIASVFIQSILPPKHTFQMSRGQWQWCIEMDLNKNQTCTSTP